MASNAKKCDKKLKKKNNGERVIFLKNTNKKDELKKTRNNFCR